MSKQPNILYVFSDQQRWDTVGCYGQKLPITPNLDKLAEDGVRFDNAYTCQPVCGPARACIQTGKFATEVNCETNHRLLPLNEDTIAKQLRRQGYEVGYIGKWHLASYGPRDGADDFRVRPVPTERRGGYLDYWLASDTLEFTSHGYDGYMFDQEGNARGFPLGRYRVDAQTDWVLEYLKARDGEKPWFLFVSYIEPHHQNDHGCYEGPHGSKERWADYEVPGDLVGTKGDWRENYPDYLGCCHSLDENLGRIIKQLERINELDNTVIIYTSDHGSHFCTRNGEYKRACHDGCTHIPMVIRGPGFRGGKVVEAMTSLLDTPSTVLKAGGVEPPAFMQGRTLQDVIDEVPDDWPEEAFMQISESQRGRAIRTARWTYSVRAPEGRSDAKSDGPCREYVEDFLYDNDVDPHQKQNLVADPAYDDTRAELRERLLAWMERAHEQRPTITPAPA